MKKAKYDPNELTLSNDGRRQTLTPKKDKSFKKPVQDKEAGGDSALRGEQHD